jgi:hypothetical protein
VILPELDQIVWEMRMVLNVVEVSQVTEIRRLVTNSIVDPAHRV